MASNIRTAPDQVLVDIADYVLNYHVTNAAAVDAAALSLTDTLAGALDAIDFPECVKMIGPSVPGTVVPNGARVPGTNYVLDPETAAFSLGCLIRWLDYNDTFNAAQGSHPSDNLAGVLMLADHLSRQRAAEGTQSLPMRLVLEALIKAYEIQGCLAIENGLGVTGLMDQNLLTRVASSAVLTGMLGGTHEHIVNAVSNAFMDCSLMVYRHAPNTGSRKSWACADAVFDAMRLAKMAVRHEMGYPSVLTAPKYGFYDARFQGRPFQFQRPYGDYIIQNSNFKFVAAGMHSQTSVECAFLLHPAVKDRIGDIERIEVRCTDALMKVMNKTGPLHNPADRDHCAQYIIALCLLHGKLDARDYEDEVASDRRIDELRGKMTLTEEAAYTRSFYDPNRRSNGSSLQIWFKDGTSTAKAEVEYPAGHSSRRAGVIPVLQSKFETSLARRFEKNQQDRILKLMENTDVLYTTPVHEFVNLFCEHFV